MTAACSFEVLTLFPEVVDAFVRAGVLGKAIERGVVQVHATNIRDFSTGKHRSVDDTPFGGGAGMVMNPGPVLDALEHVAEQRGPLHRVLLTPSAPRFDQRAAERLAKLPRVGLVCGRYEGIDDRIREHYIDECFSIGDYVLGGGEVAALVVIEAVSRLVDGVLGNPESASSESFSDAAQDGSTLEYPQYTRPAEFRGHPVPPVLMSGDHAAIARWRSEAARRRTWELRPDLRPARAIPAATPRWLAIDASQAADVDELARVAMSHRVAGVALLGADVGSAAAWAAATGGKLATAALPNLKALCKRLKRASGIAPWVVRLRACSGAGDEVPHEARSPAELADVLGAVPSAKPRAIVLWIPDPSTTGLGTEDAVYAPDVDSLQRWVAEAGRGLAINDAIVDARRPRCRPAVLADVALATLPRSPDPERYEP
ncbi:MAG: tRNA (guanosine(37)-N1)-methyltransferase TrmD [Nannocystaceae bacterium]|nr:tRNA (guanosine(37)-N1)-methyltransferase TrmD [Nannocystaceae bacterium]